MKILCISDKISDVLTSQNIKNKFSEIEMILSCGDLPFKYYEYLSSLFNVPLYYVYGNHSSLSDEEYFEKFDKYKKKVIHNKMKKINNLNIIGFSGSLKYNNNHQKFSRQYTEFQRKMHILKNVPRLLYNKFKNNKYIDIVVSHAPPFGLNDNNDNAHKGFKTLLNFIIKYQPKYYIHGHIHLYDKNKNRECFFYKTKIINVYKYYILEI